jgi:HAMP domain-containing protein
MSGPDSTVPLYPEMETPWWHALDPRRSLRARAALGAGIGFLALTLLASWGIARILRAEMRDEVGARLEALAAGTADKLDRALSERYRELEFTAALGPLRAPDASSDERRRLLESVREKSSDYAWIGLADARGTIGVATGRALEGTNVGVRDWFRIGQNKPYLGDVHDAPELSPGSAAEAAAVPRRVLDLSRPIMAVNGQLVGVLGAQLNWTTLAPEIVQSVLPATARRARIGLTIYSARREVLLDSGGSGWSEPFEAPELPDRSKLRGFLLEDTANGVSFVTGYARSRGSRDFLGLGWLVTVRQPLEEAFAPAQTWQRQILQAGLFATLAAAAIGWVLASRLTQRLRVIGAAAGRIGEGDVLTVMPLPQDRGELSAMCGALGRMVDEFRQRQDALESENLQLKARLAAQTRPMGEKQQVPGNK